MNRKTTLWITRTALLLALLIVVQAVTSGFGSTLLTGSLVNLILIVAAVIGGFSSGLTVALLSPIFAYFFGIGPAFWQIVACVMLANSILVIIWSIVTSRMQKNVIVGYVSATVIAAVAKFGFLYFAVVKFAVPVLLGLPNPQATVVSAAFSYPQLITALIGGGLSCLILPILAAAFKPSTSRH